MRDEQVNGPSASMGGRNAIFYTVAQAQDAIAGCSGFVTDRFVKPGWITLAVHVRCPAGCVGGEQLAGGDLVECGVCRNDGVVPVGIGGAAIMYCVSRNYELDGEDFTDWIVHLSHVVIVAKEPAEWDVEL